MAPLKKYWDEGHLAIIQGIGYPNGSLSHFRSMDIWATCEPEELGLTGWLGSVIQDVDPIGENVLTGYAGGVTPDRLPPPWGLRISSSSPTGLSARPIASECSRQHRVVAGLLASITINAAVGRRPPCISSSSASISPS